MTAGSLQVRRQEERCSQKARHEKKESSGAECAYVARMFGGVIDIHVWSLHAHICFMFKSHALSAVCVAIKAAVGMT